MDRLLSECTKLSFRQKLALEIKTIKIITSMPLLACVKSELLVLKLWEVFVIIIKIMYHSSYLDRQTDSYHVLSLYCQALAIVSHGTALSLSLQPFS